MNEARTSWRRLFRRLAPILGVLLAISALAVAAHHHDGPATHDHCAVCTAGPTLALSPDPVQVPALPALNLTRVTPADAPTPRAGIAPTHRGRAPPTA
jgi:hypothetical protein